MTVRELRLLLASCSLFILTISWNSSADAAPAAPSPRIAHIPTDFAPDDASVDVYASAHIPRSCNEVAGFARAIQGTKDFTSAACSGISAAASTDQIPGTMPSGNIEKVWTLAIGAASSGTGDAYAQADLQDTYLVLAPAGVTDAKLFLYVEAIGEISESNGPEADDSAYAETYSFAKLLGASLPLNLIHQFPDSGGVDIAEASNGAFHESQRVLFPPIAPGAVKGQGQRLDHRRTRLRVNDGAIASGSSRRDHFDRHETAKANLAHHASLTLPAIQREAELRRS